MMQNTAQPGSQEWRSDSQLNNNGRFNGDQTSPVSQVKPEEPQFNEGGIPPGDDIAAPYEFMPTPFNPPRIDRCRIDNFVMLGMMALTFIFGVAALATPIVSYKSSAITITVDCLYVWGVSSSGQHQQQNNHRVFCSDFTTKSDGFAALFILCVLFSVLGFVLSVVPIVCGRVLCGKFFVHIVMVLIWFFSMVGMALGAQMRNDKLCNGTSLHAIGFRYGAAFGLAVTIFVLLTLVLIFLVVWTIKYPAKLRS